MDRIFYKINAGEVIFPNSETPSEATELPNIFFLIAANKYTHRLVKEVIL